MEPAQGTLTSIDFPNLLPPRWPPPIEILEASKTDAMAIIIWGVKQTDKEARILLAAAQRQYPNEAIIVEHGHITMGSVPCR